jgi:hypothetical protein
MSLRMLLQPATTTLLTLIMCLAFTTRSEATSPTITNISPSFGTTGSTVTIYGSNFGSSGSVEFNGTLGTVVSWTSTEITVTIPSSATTGLVTVTNSAGTGTSGADFNVISTDGSLAMGAFPPQNASCPDITDYNGTNCVGDYRSDVIPEIDGVVIVGQWSSIESSSGSESGGYSWTSLDNAINTFVGKTNWGASKKVGIVLSPVTDGSSNSSTPAYVYTSGWATTAGASTPLDQCTCTDYAGDSGVYTTNGCWNQSNSGGNTDTSGMPAVWEKPFYVALENFYSAAVSHLNSVSYSPYIAYIRMGLSTGGEGYPHCSGNLETLVSPSNASELETVWTDYTDTMFTYEAGLNSQHPLMAAPNGNGTSSGVPSDSWADTEAQDALNEGLSLGSEGLQYNDTIQTPCSNDWCNTFTFTPTPPIKELQTYADSNPSQTTCNSSGDYGTNDVNSLTCILPFVEGKANSVELYPEDVFLAFDSNTTGYSSYGSGYATAIGNLRAGN